MSPLSVEFDVTRAYKLHNTLKQGDSYESPRVFRVHFRKKQLDHHQRTILTVLGSDSIENSLLGMRTE